MKLALRIAVSTLGICLCPAFPSVLVTLTNGSQVGASAVSREHGDVVLSVGTGTITVSADQVQQLEEIEDPTAPLCASSVNRPEPKALLIEASAAQALPPEFIESVARVESGLRLEAVSKKGALGLMQLMPKTAAALGVDAATPAENAVGGAKYLRELLLRYNGDARLALAAYNAGPAAVDRYHGVPPYPETIEYINRVLRQYERARKLHSQTRPGISSASGNLAPSRVRTSRRS